MADFCGHATFDRRKTTVQTLPLFCIPLFIQTVQECGIRLLQSAREADALLAAMANALKCSVVSQDSDFFIFDIKYGRSFVNIHIFVDFCICTCVYIR